MISGAPRRDDGLTTRACAASDDGLLQCLDPVAERGQILELRLLVVVGGDAGLESGANREGAILAGEHDGLDRRVALGGGNLAKKGRAHRVIDDAARRIVYENKGNVTA